MVLNARRPRPGWEIKTIALKTNSVFCRFLEQIEKVMEKNTKQSRYSDTELTVFKERILGKLTAARADLSSLMLSLNSSSFNESDGNYKTLEDGAATLEKESINQLAARQKKFIAQLEDALVRIENKTYGICKITGKLIQKERLMAVPHTTMSMEAKLKQDSHQII